MAPLSLATNCISLFLAYTLVTLYRVNCSDALVYSTSGKLLSSSKIIPHSSIAIPQAALKSERYAWQAPGCHRIGEYDFLFSLSPLPSLSLSLYN